MNANEKIYVKHYAAYTTEDIFCHGEVGETRCVWTSRENPVRGRFDTLEDALKAVCEANCFDYVPANCLNVGRDMPEDAGLFEISVMVDVNNCEATRYEIEEWKAGRRRLWNCTLSVYLGVCAERNLTPEEVASWEGQRLSINAGAKLTSGRRHTQHGRNARIADCANA